MGQILGLAPKSIWGETLLVIASYNHAVHKFEKALVRHRRCSRYRSLSAKVAEPNDGLPPFDHRTLPRVFLDSDLLQYDPVNEKSG